MGRRDRDPRRPLAAMEIFARAELILETLATGDEMAIAEIVEELQALNAAEATLAMLDCLVEAQARDDPDLDALVHRYL